MDNAALYFAKLCGSLEGMAPELAPSLGSGASAVYVDDTSRALVFRGTVDVVGWLHDFDVADDVVYGLGPVHRGFYDALASLMPKIPTLLGGADPAIVSGHSLGAAMAILYAGVLAARGVATTVYAFEPPRVAASDKLAELLAHAGVKWLATRNGNDVVTQVPSWLVTPGPLATIGRAAYPLDNFTDHHIKNVVASIASSTSVLIPQSL